MNLRLSEKVVAEVMSVARVFTGKDNSLGIRIASKAVSVKVKNADGEVEKKAMTPIALFSFENGEVEIRNLFAEQMDVYPEKDQTVAIAASDFFTAIGAFTNIEGGVNLEIDDEKQITLCSQNGGIRLIVAIRQPLKFSKAKPENFVELTVDGDQFRRACGAVSGMNTGFYYDGDKLMMYGGNAGASQFIKVLLAPSERKGELKDTIDVVVTYQAAAKIGMFFKGQNVTIILTKEKVILKDRFSWYESPVIAAPRIKAQHLLRLDKIADAKECQCLMQHDILIQALAPMRAATAILKSQSTGAVWLYMTYADTVVFNLKDGSRVVFTPAKIQCNEKEFKIAMDQALFESTVSKLGNMQYLAAAFSYASGGAGALATMQPVISDEKGQPKFDETITGYCLSLGYKEAYGTSETSETSSDNEAETEENE